VSVFLHATMQIRPFRGQDFDTIFRHWRPIAESLGWKLVVALNSHIGRAFEVIVIWEIPDANDYERFHAETAQLEEWTKWRPLLAEILEAETSKIMTRAPF
jgi:NIPSNAP